VDYLIVSELSRNSPRFVITMGAQIFQKTQDPSQNYMLQNGDKKHELRWKPTNISAILQNLFPRDLCAPDH